MSEKIGNVPERLPRVSFDLSLGERFGYIDFDFECYIEYLEERGLSDNHIYDSALKLNRHSFIRGGIYRPSSDMVETAVPYTGSQEKTNGSLRHEIQHKIDHDLGIWRLREGLMTLASYISQPASVLTIIPPAFMATESISTSVPYEINRGRAGLIALNIGMIAIFAGSYYLNPLERRAFRAQKEGEEQFITFHREYPVLTEDVIDENHVHNNTPQRLVIYDWAVEAPDL